MNLRWAGRERKWRALHPSGLTNALHGRSQGGSNFGIVLTLETVDRPVVLWLRSPLANHEALDAWCSKSSLAGQPCRSGPKLLFLCADCKYDYLNIFFFHLLHARNFMTESIIAHVGTLFSVSSSSVSQSTVAEHIVFFFRWTKRGREAHLNIYVSIERPESKIE